MSAFGEIQFMDGYVTGHGVNAESLIGLVF